MAAHKYWRIRVIKDSNFFGGGNYYLNVKEMGFYDAAMVRLVPDQIFSNGYFGAYPPALAFDANNSTLLSLDTNNTHKGDYSWVMAQFATPVSAVFFKYLPDSNNCPLEFTIDYSDDNIVWKESIRHTMAQVTTESIFPTGSKIAQSAAGAFPMWRIRMTIDTGSLANSNHYQNFKAVKFINGSGAIVTPVAAFSSGYDSASGTPTNAFGGGTTAIFTNGLYSDPKTNCYLGMAASTAFRPSKVQFIMQTGQGIQASNASFVLEGSTNGKTWFVEAEYINQPFTIDTLMDFAVPGALNSDMTMKKLSELPYTELTAAQAKDALVPLSGIGDEADTLYKVTLSDLAAMLVNAEKVGVDYHKEHRGWRIIFNGIMSTSTGGYQSIGDLTFLDRAGNTIAATGGTPYSYNGATTVGYGPDKAFDGDPSSAASSQQKPADDIGNTATTPYALGYIFASPKDIGSIKITPATGLVGNAPKAFAIQYSDDGGISWTSFSAYENVTDWATGVSKQFYLPSAGISTSGINYGKDFWRSMDFSTGTTMFSGRPIFPASQIISGGAPGRRLIIEAMIKKATNGDAGILIGDALGAKAYYLTAQSDSNLVSYFVNGNTLTAFDATGGNAGLYGYNGYYHFKMEININDIAAGSHALTFFINGMLVRGTKQWAADAQINLTQDLKIFVHAPTVDAIKWCHYRWDDNGLDIPVLEAGSGGGSTTPTDPGDGQTVVVGGSPTRYYRLGGFATVAPKANEVLVLNAVADPFVFGADFVGSSGKAATPPLAAVVCSVKKNGTEIGKLTVAPSTGAVTFETTGHAAVLVSAGDVISVVAPATPDTAIGNLAFTLVGVTNTTSVYLGARVKVNTNTADNVNNRLVSWQAEEHDDGGWWSASNPDRFIVPAGVTKVRVQAGILFSNSDANTTGFAAILKNSTDPFIVDQTKLVSMSKATSSHFAGAAVNVDSGVITVVEGDYFTLTVNTGGDTAAGISAAGSFFAIEAADGSALLSGEPDILQPAPLLVTPTYRFGFFFDYAPEADERLGIHIASDAFTFGPSFAGSIGYVETPPAATFVMLVKKNNIDTIGTITVTGTGAVTFATTATSTPIGVGDRISLVAPSAKDTVIAGGSFTFKGTF